MAEPHTVMVDCRWLGPTGVGRVTGHLLDGLRAEAPAEKWILWGPEAVTAYLWTEARAEVIEPRPLSMGGQAQALSVPRADLSLFLHAVRPLTVPRSLVLVHDTIPLRWGGSTLRRSAWRRYFRLSARRAAGVIVYSDATRRRVIEDLGVVPLGQVRLPSDPGRARRVRARRAGEPPSGHRVLYIGLGHPHKNLRRAVEAFTRSAVARGGGTFTLVGLKPDQRRDLIALVSDRGWQGIEVRGHVDEDELDELYVAASVLIQPSLEEGWGLTVVEALDAGIQVCCSGIEPMTEAAAGQATLFDPESVEAMARGIDRAMARARAGEAPGPGASTTARDFARSMVELVGSGLARTARSR